MISSSELAKLMECPICLDISIPPIRNCLTGHTICSFCGPKLKKCAICSKKFTNSRNFLAEAIFDASELKCQYESEGCSKILSGSILKAHMLECEFRPLLCSEQTVNPCNKTPVDFTDFVRHLKRKHEGQGWDTEHQHFNKIEKSSLSNVAPWPLLYMTFDNKKFLKHTFVEKAAIYWWISLLGTAAEAENYKASITIFHKDRAKITKVKFTVPVHCIRTSFQEIKNTTGCACLSKEYLVPFCMQNYKTELGVFKFAWEMQFTIRKLTKK